MSSARHARLKALFEELAGLEPGSARTARLRELCPDDEALWREVEELLAFDGEDDPASGVGFAAGSNLRRELDSIWEGGGSVLHDADESSPARYEILRLLGEGGFGTVYLAREREPIERLVAIKRIKLGMDTREVLARFEAERRALGAMDHPSIARVVSAGSDPSGRPYFVMEYVEGAAIADFSDEERLSVAERLELLIEVCQAVQHAHQKGIVHRDLKSSNVLVSRVDGRPFPKVIDFGIAKAVAEDAVDSTALTREGQLLGTPLAMSPEQVLGHVVDTRTDVYALGALAYELLTGASPLAVEGSTTDLARFRDRVLHEEPLRPSVRLSSSEAVREVAARRGVTARTLERQLATDLDWIVLRALAKEPARRYSSASDLAEDLRRFLRNEPVAARQPSRSYQVAKFVRRHRVGLAVASSMLVLLVAGTIGTGLGWSRSARALHSLRAQERLTQANLTRALAAEENAVQDARRAEDQAALALSINQFLTEDLLSSASPEALGYDVRMRTVLDVAASRIAGRFDHSPLVERSIRLTLGKTYRALSLLEPAEEQLSAALALVPAPDPSDPAASARARAEIVLELARVRLQENLNEEAEELLRPLSDECFAVLGHDDVLAIEVQHDLAVSLAEQGRFDEAADLFDRVRASALDAVGEKHELATRALHSLGLLGMTRANFEDRVPDVATFEHLAEARRESLTLHGADDPRSIRVTNDLAQVFMASGDNERALELLQDAYDSSKRIQGRDHPMTATTMLSMGYAHWAKGHLELARAAFEEAHEATRGLSGKVSIAQQAHFALTRSRLEEGRLDEALELALSLWDLPDVPGRPAHLFAELLAKIYASRGEAESSAHWNAVAADLQAHARHR